MWAFACIWAGLVLYTADSFLASRQAPAFPVPPPATRALQSPR
ncbi:hypothetical protein OPIT5_10165 [Opitutaceae bacterium TAV5]|nr:hypothetical protein OPIT5_10165 [Opitutaceae bacterium TAV5]